MTSLATWLPFRSLINTLSDQGPSPETGDAEMYDVQATNEFTEKGEINR